MHVDMGGGKITFVSYLDFRKKGVSTHVTTGIEVEAVNSEQ